ncbi:MAG: hypothetical protein GEU90_03015 [Gemmatimonas sp.]|nr:hypothetical protein [Gemmatimonas sp.]
MNRRNTPRSNPAKMCGKWLIPGLLMSMLALGCAPVSVGPSGSTAAAARGDGVGSTPALKRLRVLGTNDFHGHLRPTTPPWANGREVGGGPALAAYFQRARDEVDAPTILIDAGDVMQGTPLSNLTSGRSTVDFYNEVGYTAAAIGNHEFDWTAETLAERIEQAEFDWLSANIFVAGSDTFPTWATPTTMVSLPGCAAGPPACDSVHVGIIGITTQTTPTAAMPSHVAPFAFGDEAEAIDRWVPVLRDGGADFVVVTAHEGAYCGIGPTENCRGPMMDIAARLTQPPDLIVSGHTHTLLSITPSGVPVVQGGSYGTNFSIVDLERVSADSVAVHVRAQPPTFVDQVVPDPEIERLLDRYLAEVGPILDDVVATLEAPLLRHGPEYPLGNLIADAQRTTVGVQVAIMNNGGIRTDLGSGPVRYEDLFRVQPFGNTLVTMTLAGEALLRALEHPLNGGRSAGHVSGVRVRYRRNGEPGRRIVEAILDSGEVIRAHGQYRVVVNNFLAEGGDGFDMLLEGADVEHTGIVDLDALIDYLAALPSPTPVPPVGRFQSVD